MTPLTPVTPRLTMDAAAWLSDPLRFIADVLRNPETGAPFDLYPAEAEFLRRALTPLPDGRLTRP